jgi:hypothetical protein
MDVIHHPTKFRFIEQFELIKTYKSRFFLRFRAFFGQKIPKYPKIAPVEIEKANFFREILRKVLHCDRKSGNLSPASGGKVLPQVKNNRKTHNNVSR